MMSKMQNQGYTLTSICDYVGISRQAYHKRKAKAQDKSAMYSQAEQVVLQHRQQKSRVGLRTIYHKAGLDSLLGINDYEKEMSTRGFALQPYRSFFKTTDSRGHYYKFNNLIEGMVLNSPNQVIVGDITYYQHSGQLYYIFQFQDYYTLEIKGLVGSRTLEGIYAERCLRQVFAYNTKYKYRHNLILHTDAGSQYRSHKFQSMLRNAEIQPSHAQSCFENGLSERTNGIIKNEYLVDYEIKSLNHLNSILKRIKRDHNQIWPSKRLGYKTPQAFAAEIQDCRISDRPLKTVKKVEYK